MRSLALILLSAAALALIAGPVIPPAGQASNDNVYLSATLLTTEEVNAIFHYEFPDRFTVVEVKLTPRSGPLAVKLDDFILRTDKDGEKGGPFPATQIFGEGALIINQHPDDDQNRNRQQNRSNVTLPLGIRLGKKKKKTDEPPPVEAPSPKREEPPPPELKGELKARVLAEKTTADAISGLLFFPLEKQKVKDLELLYTTPAGKLRLRFK